MSKSIQSDDDFYLGIVGGAGPLASAHFLNLFYQRQTQFVKKEQQYLRAVCVSDPSIPDRTQCLQNGQSNLLLTHLNQTIRQLLDFGSSEILILCFTLHSLLDRLPRENQKKIRNLITIALAKLLEIKQPILLMCTSATNEFQVFEKNSLWNKAKEYLIKPTAADQTKIHQMIYDLKYSKNNEVCEDINEFIKKYNTIGWMVGCTEFSLVSDCFENKFPHIPVIDPTKLLINYYIDRYLNKNLSVTLHYENIS